MGLHWRPSTAVAVDLRRGLIAACLPPPVPPHPTPPKRNHSTKQHFATHQVTLGAATPDAAAAAPGDSSGSRSSSAAAVVVTPSADAAPTRCNWYLPDASSLDRYLWSLQWFVANGYYVLAEFQPAADDPTSRNEEAFVDAWRWLWRSIACLPNFKSDLEGRVFVSLLGRPDAAGYRWEAVGGEDGASLPGGCWVPAYVLGRGEREERMMRAVCG